MEEGRAPSGRLDPRQGLAPTWIVDISDNNRGAFASEPQRRGASSPAAARARDDRDLAGEIHHNSVPLATCPRSRKVFGYLPAPHSLNEPKSLNRGPSGA